MSDPIAIETRPREDGAMAALSIALVSRLGLYALAYLSLALLPGIRKSSNIFPGNLFLDGWTRWDAGWYARIAMQGYSNTEIGGVYDTQCMPLFPMLMRGLGYLIGDVYVAGFLIANASFLAACVVLHRLVAARWGSEIARRAVVLLAVFPFSYAFSAIYTESLFLLLVCAAFLAMERRRWMLAAICISLASITRVVGVLLVIPALIEFIRATPKGSRITLKLPLLGVIASSGMIGWMIFLAIRFHNPLESLQRQRDCWSDINTPAHFALIWRDAFGSTFGQVASGAIPVMFLIHMLMLAIAVVASILAWWKLPPSYASWATTMLLISIATRWLATGRLVAVIFPMHLAFAMTLNSPRWYHALIYLSTLLLALLTIMFTQGLWVA